MPLSGWTLLYHNPRCSKSRKALEILRNFNIEPQIIEYLRNPPSLDECKTLVAYFPNPSVLIRTKEDLYKEMLPSIETPEEVAQLLSKHPSLLERPAVVHKKQAIIARPPELVEKLLTKN